MGGVAGHLAHLYDNRNLTYNKMAEILQKAASGELIGTEKTDGYNIYLGYVDGKPRAARNKGDMSRGGMTMRDLLNRVFQGGPKAKNAYVKAFQAYEKAINSLSEQERIALFGPDGEIFYNTEIQGPLASNVVNYDENIVNIHHMGHKRYNKSTNDLEVIDTAKQSAFLDTLIDRFEEITSNNDFSVRRTAFLELNKLSDDKILRNTLEKLQDAGFKGEMTINEYLENKIYPLVDQYFPELEGLRKQQMVDRILGKPGKLTLGQIGKGLPKEQKAKISAFVKEESPKIIKKAIWPLEDAIHHFGVALLRGLKSAYILDNNKEVNRLKKETVDAIKAIQAYNGPHRDAAHTVLADQLAKLQKHDRIDTVVEGFVFEYDGQLYKFTGNFAPMNQLLGLFKYGRGNIPKMVKESILEQNEGNNHKKIVAVYPGRFQPTGRHHVEVFDTLQREFGKGNVFVATSNKTDMTLKGGAPKSPFNFNEKQMIAVAAGIPGENVILARNPYNATEILEDFDPEETAVVYFVGDKDMSEDPRFANLGGYTKSGKPAYFKEWDGTELLEGFDKHGYIGVAPHVSIEMTDGAEEMSGTTLRVALKDADETDFEDIMGFYDPEIYDIVKEKLTTDLEEGTQHFLGIFRGLADEVLEETSNAGKKRVSEKIPILKDEGYPHKQAIAIAHSMEEEGQLDDEEELEEIASMAGGAMAFGAAATKKPKRRKRKLNQEEVNEAINYLLQKLGV